MKTRCYRLPECAALPEIRHYALTRYYSRRRTKEHIDGEWVPCRRNLRRNLLVPKITALLVKDLVDGSRYTLIEGSDSREHRPEFGCPDGTGTLSETLLGSIRAFSRRGFFPAFSEAGRANPRCRLSARPRPLQVPITSNLSELLARWVGDCSVRPRKSSEKVRKSSLRPQAYLASPNTSKQK